MWAHATCAGRRGEQVMVRWAYAGMAVVGVALAPAAMAASAGPVLHISSHLARNAHVSVDGRPVVIAPGYGEVETPIAAGKHSLKVTAPGGVNYTGSLTVAPGS